MKLNEKLSYGTIHGHPIYSYEQNGKFFDGLRNEVNPEGAVVQTKQDDIIQTDRVESAKAFLRNLLADGPIAKAILFKQAEGMANVFSWDEVNKAKDVMQVIISQRNKQDFWQLPES